MTYQPKVYRKQGGADLVIASGGKLDLESGSTMTVAGDVTLSGTLNITGYTRIPYQTLTTTQTATPITNYGVSVVAISTAAVAAYTLAAPVAAGMLKEIIASPTSAGTCSIYTGSTGLPIIHDTATGNTVTLGATRQSVTLLSLGTSAWRLLRHYLVPAPAMSNKAT
jgi:hypothetical protein